MQIRVGLERADHMSTHLQLSIVWEGVAVPDFSERITKVNAKVKFGVEYLCEHECKRSSLPINIDSVNT